MTRRSGARSGRVTAAQVYNPETDELPSLRKRNPIKFWVIMVAAAAMVLVSMSGIVAAILS